MTQQRTIDAHHTARGKIAYTRTILLAGCLARRILLVFFLAILSSPPPRTPDMRAPARRTTPASAHRRGTAPPRPAPAEHSRAISFRFLSFLALPNKCIAVKWPPCVAEGGRSSAQLTAQQDAGAAVARRARPLRWWRMVLDGPGPGTGPGHGGRGELRIAKQNSVPCRGRLTVAWPSLSAHATELERAKNKSIQECRRGAKGEQKRKLELSGLK